ncbi:MAG: hypothetical protein ACE5J5_03710 [Candidatus Hydrothermarchaeales archaeon]
MEKLKEDEGEVRNVICPGKSSDVFENYVFVPVNNAGFIAIKHVLSIKGDVNKKYPKELNLPSEIFVSSGKSLGIKGALVQSSEYK